MRFQSRQACFVALMRAHLDETWLALDGLLEYSKLISALNPNERT
jgi:hypothetical protein